MPSEVTTVADLTRRWKTLGISRCVPRKTLPKVIKRLDARRIAKNQQVEPAVVVLRGRDERQAQGVPRRVEQEHGRSGQDFRARLRFRSAP